MPKKFNVTGSCFPAEHYLADVSGKFDATKRMIEEGDYFVINRPRQYGKTTILQHLEEHFGHTEGCLVFSKSFEGVGNSPFEREEVFVRDFLGWLAHYVRKTDTDLSQWLFQKGESIKNLEGLSNTITQLVEKTGKKVILFIDEVDRSSNNQLFVSFLGMLRDKYLARHKEPTFHSVVLVGVHDIKSLKIKLRPNEETKLNSPWNIATPFKVDMNLLPHEIKPMLEEYALDKKIALNADKIAECLFYHTSGQPFLVSRLCKIIDEDILPMKSVHTWEEEDVSNAVQLLVSESNTNFENITKELENNPELYRLVENILIGGQQYPFTIQDPIINLGAIYGIFADQHGLAIHNRVYSEVIYNFMIMRELRTQQHINREFSGAFLLPNNQLNVEKLLLRFQNLMREEFSKKDRNFLEHQGRLIFLAFLKPILNGHGHAFKEPQISEEKRLDVLISYYGHKYLVELKIWRGKKAHEAGILQLVDYLDRQGLETGYLIIFDHAEVKEWKTQRIRRQGKRIFVVWT